MYHVIASGILSLVRNGQSCIQDIRRSVCFSLSAKRGGGGGGRVTAAGRAADVRRFTATVLDSRNWGEELTVAFPRGRGCRSDCVGRRRVLPFPSLNKEGNLGLLLDVWWLLMLRTRCLAGWGGGLGRE